MSYMKHKLTIQTGINNVNMYSYCVMHKLLNSTVNNLTPTPTHTSLVNSSNQKQDRKSVKSMYFYIFLYFIPETDQLMKYFPKM